MMMFKQMNRSNMTNAFRKTLNSSQNFDIYSPFRFLADKIFENSQDYQKMNSQKENFQKKLQQFHPRIASGTNGKMDSLISETANKEFLNLVENQKNNQTFSEKAFTQRQLRRDYSQENLFSSKLV